MIILDTNVLSELMLRVPDERVLTWLDRQPRLSIWTTSITLFEIRFGLQSMPNRRRRNALFQDFEKVLESFDRRIAPFDIEAAEHASSLMALRKARGLPRDDRDTMIAGIVLAQHATLATRNISHFDDISAPLIDPWASTSR